MVRDKPGMGIIHVSEIRIKQISVTKELVYLQAKCKIVTRLGFGKSQLYIFACALFILDNNFESMDKSSIFDLDKYGLTFLEVGIFLEYFAISIVN